MKKILISLACFWIGLMSVNSQKQVEVKIDPGHVEIVLMIKFMVFY